MPVEVLDKERAVIAQMTTDAQGDFCGVAKTGNGQRSAEREYEYEYEL